MSSKPEPLPKLRPGDRASRNEVAPRLGQATTPAGPKTGRALQAHASDSRTCQYDGQTSSQPEPVPKLRPSHHVSRNEVAPRLDQATAPAGPKMGRARQAHGSDSQTRQTYL